jgi:hypothetical protein
MRFQTKTFPAFARLAAALALSAALTASAGAALAGGRLKERVYDDSFGNLIIISPAGYKRIVVGMGHLAAEYQSPGGPEVTHIEGGKRRLHVPHCYQPPVLWKGRSYMYGLADGEIPTPPIVCK